MNLEDCEVLYHEEIVQEMRANELDTDHETPAYAWLSDRYRSFMKEPGDRTESSFNP
jgi:hypothetical protein